MRTGLKEKIDRPRFTNLIAVCILIFSQVVTFAIMFSQTGTRLFDYRYYDLFCYLLLPQSQNIWRAKAQNFFIWLAPSAAFSYTLYLVHFPLAALASAIHLHEYSTLPSGFGAGAIAALACLAFAYSAAWLVERPFLSKRLATIDRLVS